MRRVRRDGVAVEPGVRRLRLRHRPEDRQPGRRELELPAVLPVPVPHLVVRARASQLSGWLDTVAGLNPVTYILDGLRTLVLADGWQWTELGAGARRDRHRRRDQHVDVLRRPPRPHRPRLTSRLAGCPPSRPSRSRSPTSRPPTCVSDSHARAGPTRRPSTTGARACRSPTCSELCEHWERGYDLDAARGAVQLGPAVPHAIDGLNIHFLHVRSPHHGAVPLVLTHGWPGSVVEFHEVIGPLTDPVAHGGDAADAFHVVCPSLPGYGWSDKPATSGWGVERIAVDMGGADGAARLRALRRAGRRLGRGRSRQPSVSLDREHMRRHPPQHGRSRSPTPRRWTT